VRNGYQHDSISHAIATVERLGWESGLYDTFIRTDSQLITRQPVAFPANIGIASSVTPLARNLNYFDAIFFFGVREIDLTASQRSDLLAFVKDDGKGFVAAHSAITGFFSWPEFGDMIGGRFDEHPWDIVEARVVVDDRTFPATRHLPPSFVIQDEQHSDRYAVHLHQGALGLPDRDYYFDTDDRAQVLRREYVAHVGRMLRLLGDDPATAAKHASTIMANRRTLPCA